MEETLRDEIAQFLQPGTLLKGGDYRIVKSIGQGGFGITYLAEQTSLGSKVCIKEFFAKELCHRVDGRVIAAISCSTQENMDVFRRKFLNEARKLSQMRHANIVNVRDLFEENGTAYYVMEYVEGESLGQRIEREGQIDEQSARRYISGVAAAIGYLHNRNMLHLDIKPANIMLREEDDSVVVIDFGLAKHYDPTTGKQTTIYLGAGTPGYSPFEQSLSGGGVVEFTAATDIYSLGATLYAMVVGKRPPEAAIIPNEGLPALPARLSESTRRTIAKSMTYSIKQRPQSIAEFMSLLNPIKPAKKRSRWWLWLLLSLLVAAVAGVIVWFVMQRPAVVATNDFTETAYGMSMKMIWVEGDSFEMGFNVGDSDERPVHTVTLDGYWMAETEVTQAQWEAVMETTIQQQRDKSGLNGGLYGVGDNYPMYYVNYDEALEFCRRLSNATGRTYTLPTEAQWEYAARGGNGATTYTFSGSNSIDDVAWCSENSKGSIHHVKGKAPNQLGLYDMSGNVWEWCLDEYEDSYYSYIADAYCEPSSSKYVLRGGSWDCNAWNCRVANRERGTRTYRNGFRGFRVVVNPE